jgi:hypothetical protein
MHHQNHGSGIGGAGDEAGEVERRIRQGLSEIREAISHLESTYRQGKITPGELAEERDLLQAQEHGLQRNR